MSSAKQHAESLHSDGIDPESFLNVAQSAAERGMGKRSDEGLALLEAFSREVHAAGFSLYFPFESCVAPLSEVLEGRPDEFARSIAQVGGIATALGEAATKTIQRGVASVCHAGEQRPFVVHGALDFASELADCGIDPGDALLQVVPSLARVAEEDSVRVGEGLAAIALLLKDLDARGVHPSYPIQQGLCGTIEAWREELSELPEALSDLGDLVAALLDAGTSPYHVLEYGVSAALPAASNFDWLRSETFPLAVTLAGQGIDPMATLRSGIPAVAQLDEPWARSALAWAQAVAADGLDPGWFLEFSLIPVAFAATNIEEFSAALEGASVFVRALASHEHNPANTFRDGLPEAVGGVDTLRLMTASTALAVQGIDPGPSLKLGFATLRYACEERPVVAEAALVFAEGLIAQGQSPRTPLQFGLPAVLLAAGSDDSSAAELLALLGALLRDLHAEGIDTSDLCRYGISSLGRAANGDASLFETLLGLLRDLVRDLQAAGLSPVATVGTGLPAVSQLASGERAFLEECATLARTLAKRGIDPAPFLIHAVPALDQSLLEEIVLLANAAQASQISPEPLGEALAAFVDLNAEESAEALALCRELLEDGIDIALPIGHAFVAVLGVCTKDHRAASLSALADALREAHVRALPFEGLVDAAFVHGAEASGGDPGGLVSSLAAAISAASATASLPDDLRLTFLRSASHAAATVAGKRPAIFVEVLDGLAGWVLPRAEAPGIRGALVRGLPRIAHGAGGSPKVFRSLLAALEPLTLLADAEVLFDGALATAAIGAEGDPVRLQRSLGELHRIGTSCGDAAIYSSIGRLTTLVSRIPEAWLGLIVPACVGGGAGVSLVLHCVQSLERYLRVSEDLDVVREIVSQYGVRAPDLLHGLLLTGLYRGQIRSLADEQKTLLAFLRDVRFADADYYVEYRRIVQDPALAPAERRANVAALSLELEVLTQAIVAGEVTAEEEEHPLFGQVLTYVFPPARSMPREAYLSLYRSFEDRPDDVAQLTMRGPLLTSSIRLETGGYRIAAGSEIDRSPWTPLRAAVREADGIEPDDLTQLGEALFSAWMEGTLGKTQTQLGLLKRVYSLYRAAGPALPEALDDAGALLKYREFLSDTAREIIQDALAALRAAQPERYERQVRAKLAPRRRVGKGLMRGVLRTAAAFQEGNLDRGAALERLGRQLKTFDLLAQSDQDALLALDLAATYDTAASVIEGLPESAVEVELGEEHLRVLADLAGAELAAMQRELFGDGGEAGKLEYSAESGGPALEIRMEVTKRKAHAPIGICEGVCTATDAALWEKPTFLQCVFWGPDNRALGGMHVLLVERLVDGQQDSALVLPGINPSLELLGAVGAEASLDAALRYARSLANAWGFAEVWIPTHGHIATNRGPIRQALDERKWPKRTVATVSFSESPYRYVVDEVWVVPEES